MEPVLQANPVPDNPEQDFNGRRYQRYYDAADRGSYGGVDRLRRSAGGPYQRVKNWLASQDTYTLHRPARRIYPRNRVEVYGIDSQWQADLVEMQPYARYNDGYRYILMVIDVFSKYGWARPVKTKSAKDVTAAFDSILNDSGRFPLKLQTDKGKEFVNAEFQAMLKRNNNIHFFTLHSELKACVVERWNRTIKERMWRYFTKNDTSRYIDVLQDLIDAYNRSWHSSIRTAPELVTSANAAAVRQVLYPPLQPATRYAFSKGDHVRMSKNKLHFEKGYVGNWSEEIFVVSAVKKRPVPAYRLKDLQDVDIDGTFYEPELQKVRKRGEQDLFIIQKILRTRGSGSAKEHLIRWRGYPPSFNSWVKASELKTV